MSHLDTAYQLGMRQAEEDFRKQAQGGAGAAFAEMDQALAARRAAPAPTPRAAPMPTPKAAPATPSAPMPTPKAAPATPSAPMPTPKAAPATPSAPMTAPKAAPAKPQFPGAPGGGPPPVRGPGGGARGAFDELSEGTNYMRQHGLSRMEQKSGPQGSTLKTWKR